jgi:hypothetical protein
MDDSVKTELLRHGIRFDKPGDFAACREAEAWLAARGFSVGRKQRGDPRGILFGNYDIQKWRNLNTTEMSALHGLMTGNMRNGPVMVRLLPKAPDEAKEAFLRMEGMSR